MHIILVLPIFSFLFAARASSLDSRWPDAHPLDARDVTDVCSLVSTEFEVPDSDGNTEDIGLLQGCICLSQIPWLLTAPGFGTIQDAVSVAGTTVVNQLLTDLITAQAPKHCNYPDNSVPMCTGEGGENPCGFTCTNGYTASGNTCICAAPKVLCNGQCGTADACPSSQATPQRRWVGSGSCTEMGHGWAACGVFGGGARAWECVNTARDLESCGGCVLPLTPFSPIGQDCTALPGVADVSCLSGECVVHRCMSGYALSRDGTHCVSAQAHISRPHVSIPEDDEEYMQAMRYGLEHRPF